MKKRAPKKKRGRDVIDPTLRRPIIEIDGTTVRFPKGWTRAMRDEFRRVYVWEERDR